MNHTFPIVVSEVTDPSELAQARAQQERADRNSAWLQAHVPEIYVTTACCVLFFGAGLQQPTVPRFLPSSSWTLERIAPCCARLSCVI